MPNLPKMGEANYISGALPIMMNDDPRYSICTVVAAGCWIGTGFLLVIAWLTWAMGGEAIVAMLVAETACVLSAVAAVIQIRRMASQVCRLIRVSSGLDGSTGEEGADADVQPFTRPRR